MDDAILDKNYEHLRECVNSMVHELIRNGLHPVTIIRSEQLRIDEYLIVKYLNLYNAGSMITCVQLELSMHRPQKLDMNGNPAMTNLLAIQQPGTSSASHPPGNEFQCDRIF